MGLLRGCGCVHYAHIKDMFYFTDWVFKDSKGLA